MKSFFSVNSFKSKIWYYCTRYSFLRWVMRGLFKIRFGFYTQQFWLNFYSKWFFLSWTFFPDSLLSKRGVFRLSPHKAGFYSCYSLLLEGVIRCSSQWLCIVRFDTTRSFQFFKDRDYKNEEMSPHFWQSVHDTCNPGIYCFEWMSTGGMHH